MSNNINQFGVIKITEKEKAYLEVKYQECLNSTQTVVDTKNPDKKMNLSWEELDTFMESLFKKYNINDKEYGLNYQTGEFIPLSRKEQEAIQNKKDPNELT